MANKLVWDGGERRMPRRYSGFNALLKSCVMARLRYVLPYVHMDYDILDLGCGTGWNTKYVSLYCRHIWGIDISHEAIKYAKKHNDAKNITWKRSAMHILDNFEDASKDLVITIAAIEHIDKEEMEQVFREAHRTLKPGAFLVGTTTKFHKKSKVNATPWHRYEPGFKEFQAMATPYFTVRTLENFTMRTPDLTRPTTEGLFVFKRK